MESVSWARLHGAAVHFPIALSLVSGVLDAIGFGFAARPVARELHRGGCCAMWAAAGGAAAAVVSGLIMTRGDMLGHGLMRWHHLYAWPAFGLLVGLAVWRGVAGVEPSRRAMGCYLIGAMLAAGLVAAAGYWGGELLMSGGSR
jgi:uncharacterized membrane protein